MSEPIVFFDPFKHGNSNGDDGLPKQNIEAHGSQLVNGDTQEPESRMRPALGSLSPSECISPLNEKSTAQSSVSARSVRFSTPTKELDDDPSGPEPGLPPRALEALPDQLSRLFRTVLRRKVHWVSRRVMIGFYIIAFAVFIGNYVFFAALVGKAVGNEWDQQKIRFISNVLPYAVQVSLVISVDISLTQWLYMAIASRIVSVRTLDAALSSTSSLLFLFNREMYTVIPEISALALLIGLLTIPTTLTAPGTLYVEQSLATTESMMDVPRLAISSTDLHQSNFFHYSRPLHGLNSTDNTTVLFEDARTIVSRLTKAAVGTGQILLLPAPAVNATYNIQFYGPYVSCDVVEPGSSIAALIDEAMALELQAAERNNMSAVYAGFFAYVPDLSSPDRYGQPNQRDTDPSRASNELWLSFKQNGTGWTTDPFPRCPQTRYRRCRVCNTTFDLDVEFHNGDMRISRAPSADLDPVPYPGPTVNTTHADEIPRLSYAAYMLAFTDLLVGSMALYAQDVANRSMPWINIIDSGIENTALLGSADLDCFFALDWMYGSGGGSGGGVAGWREPSPQRQQDIDFARHNATLDLLIPELSVNLTVSLMSDGFLAPSAITEVKVSSMVDLYAYHAQTLLISYSMALLAAGVALGMGLVAFQRNEVRVDRSFSWTASATDHMRLFDEEHRRRRGSIPIPEKVGEKRLLFQRLDEEAGGGWGFVVVTEDQVIQRRRPGRGIFSLLTRPLKRGVGSLGNGFSRLLRPDKSGR